MNKILASLVGAIFICAGALIPSASVMNDAAPMNLVPHIFHKKYPIPQTTPLVITFDPGGSIMDFIAKYEDLAKSRTPVVVKGECISACTLMIGLLNPAQVCVTPDAMFAFHSAKDGAGSFSQVGTQIIWYIYPKWVRELLAKHGMGPDIEHPELIWIPGTTFYHQCFASALAS